MFERKTGQSVSDNYPLDKAVRRNRTGSRAVNACLHPEARIRPILIGTFSPVAAKSAGTLSLFSVAPVLVASDEPCFGGLLPFLPSPLGTASG